jgi:hypothetical protein
MSDEMTDGELFKAWDKQKQAKRAANRESGLMQIHKTGVAYTSHNAGAHIVITCARGIIDFWPGTGKYITRQWKGGYGLTGRGLRHVLRLIEESKK